MAINYASKYSNVVDEKFTKASFTQAAVNTNYDFAGVNAVNVYSLDTVAMGDYAVSGTSRYGTPSELQDATQTLKMTRDRSFTFTIDRRNYTDTMMVREAGRALSRQLEERTIPEVDTYRLSVITANAGTTKALTITAANAYSEFLTGVTTLLDNKAPLSGTFAFIGSNFYKQIRLDSSFIKASDMAQEMLVRGQVGMVEGIPIIHVPASYLPTGTEFVISNQVAVPSAQKIESYKIHDNPPGINGWLVEGRIYYDAWVLTNKKPVIYLQKVTVTP